MTHIIHYDDICFTVKATLQEWQVDFEIFQLISCEENGVWKAEFQKKESTGFPDPTPEMEHALAYITGRVKSDGCSDWDFDEEGFHFCHRSHLSWISEVMTRCYDWTSANHPKWIGA